MSLVLRQLTQEMLDKNGLSMLHAEVSDYKKLTLVGECGQPFLTANGIRFSKKIPSVREVEYAAQLLEKYVNKNKKKIQQAIEARRRRKEAEEEKSAKRFEEIKSIDSQYGYRKTKIILNEEMEIVLKRYESASVSLVDVDKMLNDDEFLEDARNYFNKNKELKRLRSEENSIISELSKCGF